MGWIFLQAGIEKIVDDFSSQSFLENAIHEANPFIPLFEFFATQTSWIDPLIIWSQLLMGFALLFGIFFRTTAFFAGLQLFLFWIAAFQGGLLAGFPVEHGFLVDSSLVYIVLLFGLGSLGAGRIYGVDKWLENTKFVKNNSWLKYFLG